MELFSEIDLFSLHVNLYEIRQEIETRKNSFCLIEIFGRVRAEKLQRLRNATKDKQEIFK